MLLFLGAVLEIEDEAAEAGEDFRNTMVTGGTMVLGGTGIIMSISVAMFGLFLFSGDSLTQITALDLAESKGPESTLIGLNWGGNAFFDGAYFVIAGIIVGTLGRAPAFYFSAGLFFICLLVSLILPRNNIPQSNVA